MFRKRIFKVLNTLFLLLVLSARQVNAAPDKSNFDSVATQGNQAGVSTVTALDTISFTDSTTVPDYILFTNTGSMNVSRSGHTATLLNNGKVLVAGGGDASAELYDPDTGTWSDTSTMNVGRWGHTATLLNNGKVLVAGGFNSGYLASAELYDPVAGTWSDTIGSMNVARSEHTATLLNNGKVLVAGGKNNPSPSIQLNTAELYDPDTETWSSAGSMSRGRYLFTATLLNNGKVLVAGGFNIPTASAELYDPDTSVWNITGGMNVVRQMHTATLLNNGKVLIAGGYKYLGGFIPSSSSTELYDPDTGTWSITGGMSDGYGTDTATLLNNGKVLAIGGVDISQLVAVADLYDSATGTWSKAPSMNIARVHHTATLLNNGKVLLAGGYDGSTYLASAELATLIPSHTFTGTLTLPSGWTNGTINAEFVGATSAAAINAGALSNDNNTWGGWATAISNVPVTTTWNISGEGANRPIYLRLRDVNGQETTVVTGTVNVDLTPPTSSMTPLPSFVGSTAVPLSWSGSDTLSGIATYDLQGRAESDTQWTDILSNTTQTSYTFNGLAGTTYYFRVRAKDAVGNIEAWREPYDASTVGIDYGLTINMGALFTNSTHVVLTIAGKPETRQMQVANDGGFAGVAWEAYTSHRNWQIIQYGSYVLPRVVYVRYKDSSGNVSGTYQDDIILDVMPPTGTVNVTGITNGLQAAATTVTLKLSATDDVSGVGKMMISNRADFAGAVWENYATSRAWTVGSNTALYYKFQDNAGNASATKSIKIPKQNTINGGFNTYTGASKIPANWNALNFSVTDGKDKSVKKEGAASLKIIGAAGKIKTLTQTLNISGTADNTFIFSYWTKGTSLPTAGICQGQVSFYNGTTLKGTKTLKCPAGKTYTWKNINLSFSAPAAYTKVEIKFTYSKASGTVWFDGVSLLK